MWKIENIGGLKVSILEWMKDYMEDHKMRTVVRDRILGWKGEKKWNT